LNSIELASFTAINKSNCLQLISYVKGQLEYYVENVLLEKKRELREDEEYFVKLLNSEIVSNKHKQELIKKQSKTISDITLVISELWNTLLAELKVDATWENLITYHSKQDEISDNLIDYINDETNYKTL